VGDVRFIREKAVILMNDSEQPLQLLYAAEAALILQVNEVISFLPSHGRGIDQALNLIHEAHRILPSTELISPCLAMLKPLITQHAVERSIASWPFEQFWGNPDEPRHSKLLGYFIRPNESHGCGELLLRELFKIIDVNLLVDVHTKVKCEDDHIDILITRNVPGEPIGSESPSQKYAVIIENKINGARDQANQLPRYFEEVKGRGFLKGQIHMFYLPLFHRTPPFHCGIVCNVITFRDHILRWLEKSIRIGESGVSSELVPKGMIDNLSHYADLVRHKIRQYEGEQMHREIIRQLSRAEADGTLPEWSAVQALKTQAIELEFGYRLLIRMKLLQKLKLVLEREYKLNDLSFSYLDRAIGKIGKDVPIMELSEKIDNIQLSLGCRLGEALVFVELNCELSFNLGYRKCQEAIDKNFNSFLQEKYPGTFQANEWWYHYEPGKAEVESWQLNAGSIAKRVAKLHGELLNVVKEYEKHS
jgi:hypothetical protein